MSAIIINNIPISGKYPEHHFGEHFKSSLWIEFIDNNSNKWFGCFSKEHDHGFNKVLINKENTTAFVVSDGQDYIIDIENRKIKFKTEEHPLIVSLILTENPNYFIVGTFYEIYIFNSEKRIKKLIPNLILDGIYFNKQEEKQAVGDLSTAENQYNKNILFEFNLETFSLKLEDTSFLS